MKPDTKAIRARADAATPAPWLAETDCFDPDSPEIEACVTNIDGSNLALSLLFTSSTNLKATPPENWAVAEASQEMLDARFMAAARVDVPALCDRVERLEMALAEAIRIAKTDDFDHLASDHVIVAECERVLEGT